MAAKDLGYGSYTKAKSSMGASYPSSKSPLQKMTDDFLMDIGSKKKDADYYSRLGDRKRRTQEAVASRGGGDRSPQGPTPEQQYEAKVAREKAAERAEGQKKRKAFEKNVGEKVAARKKMLKLLNIPTGV